jgi:hypothetical protein
MHIARSFSISNRSYAENMFIGYGFPKIFNAGNGKEEDWLYVTQDLNYIIAVSHSAVQVWSAGLHRFKLSQVVRIEEDIIEEGGNLSAYWCPAKCTLAILVRIVLIHTTELCTCNLKYLRDSSPLSNVCRPPSTLSIFTHFMLGRMAWLHHHLSFLLGTCQKWTSTYEALSALTLAFVQL